MVDEADILHYLKDNPDFLRRHASALSEANIDWPRFFDDSNIIDVTDKIAKKARNEARKAAQANESLLSVAAENMLHWQELHLATLGFLACNDLGGFARMIDEELPIIFGLAGSRLIMPASAAITEAESLGFLVLPDDEITSLCRADSIYMGPPPETGIALFANPVASMAIMPLPDQLGLPVAGSALILAGRKSDSFEQGKGRTLLLHLAEMVGVCLLSLIEKP